jgi:alpha-D-ribose 1-methylphosphonate 5-triphosphate synthase subunit PhnG
MSEAAAIIIAQMINSTILLVGTFVAWRIGRGQIKATSITTNRQVWIGELRQEVAKIITAQTEFDALGKIYTTGDPEHERVKRELNDQMDMSYSKVLLLLAEREHEHDQLADVIDAFMQKRKERKDVIEATTKVLRDEHRRIEAGE